MLKPITIVPWVNQAENELPSLKICLESIRLLEPKITVVLVSPNPSSKAPSFLNDLNIAFIRRKEQGNREEAVNMAIKWARDKYNYDCAIIIDQAVEMKTPFAMKCIASPFAISGAITYLPDGRLMPTAIEEPKFSDPVTGKVLVTSGSFHSLDLSRVEKYKTTFAYPFSDYDLCLRAWEQGHNVGVLSITCVLNGPYPKRDLPEYRRKSYRWDRINAAASVEPPVAMPLPL